jgi:type I restriction enzyme, S subunit
MSLPEYQDYRVAKAEGVDKIPSHWELPPMYLRYEVELGKMLDTRRITGESLMPYLRNVDVQWGRINFDDLPEMDIEQREVDRYTIQSGDLLVCEGGEVGRAAVVGQVHGSVAFQKALHRLRPVGAEEISKYMFYVFRWACDSGVFTNNGQSTIAHLTAEQLRKYRFPRPPKNEQGTIVDFLDREVAKIDALIAEQKKLLALLVDKQQVTISNAVIRGLNTNPYLKDSDIPWMGFVPAHWDVQTIKRLTLSIEQGWSPQCESFPAEGADEWGVLKVGCVNGGTFLPAENKKLPEDLEPIHEYALKRNDLLISRANTRDLVGSAALVPEDFPGLLLCDKLYRLRLDEAVCDPVYVAAFLSTAEARSQIENSATGASSSMLNIGQAVILDMAIPVPPLEEQQKIMLLLASECGRIDRLKSEVEAATHLLKERRSALISAAVTGKIDVRGLVEPKEAA